MPLRAHLLDRLIGDHLPVLRTPADVAAFEAEAPYEQRVAVASTWQALRKGASLDPLAPAITFLPNADPAEAGETWTHAHFNARVVQMGNALHALFSPEGLRDSVVNWEAVARFTLQRLHQEIALNPDDPERNALREDLLAWPGVPARFRLVELSALADPVLTLHLRRGADEVRLFTTLTSLGTPLDVTAQELIIESYFPADAATERFLRRLAAEEGEAPPGGVA